MVTFGVEGVDMQIAFAVKALQTPSNIPLSIATLTLIQRQTEQFSHALFGFLDNRVSVSAQVAMVKDLYDMDQLENKVKDGYKTIPDVEGVSVEFNVSIHQDSAVLHHRLLWD